MSVDLILSTYEGDLLRVYKHFEQLVEQHNHAFNRVFLVQQRVDYEPPAKLFHIAKNLIWIRSDDWILEEFGIVDRVADLVAPTYITEGRKNPYHWRNHLINQLTGAFFSDAEHLVFSDSDIVVKSSIDWIECGIATIKDYDKILTVCPDEGGNENHREGTHYFRSTKSMSQQLFLMRRDEFMSLDFTPSHNEEAPFKPFREFYYLLEGRIWRNLMQRDLFRAILRPELASYVHHFGKVAGKE